MKLSAQIFLGFSVVIALSLVDSYINNSLSRKVNKNTIFLTNSEAIIRTSSRLHKDIIEMQSAFRGFLLTNDENFLAPYYVGLKEIPNLFIEQKKLIAASQPQRLKLDSIHILHKEWISYANSLITSKKEASKVGASGKKYQELFETKLKKQVGKLLNDKISHKFQEFDRNEYRNRQIRRNILFESIENTKTVSLVFIILTIMLGIVSSVFIVNIISKRIVLMVNVAKNISQGDFTEIKDNKNDELTSLSRSLNIMSGTLNKNIKELEKRNTELNQFAYVVSHDLKAPIRGIYNVIEWIEEDLNNELSPQMRKYLSIIPDRIKRMEDLIHGLLDYARLSREKPLKEYVNVNTLVKDIIEVIVPENFKVKLDNMPVLNTEKIRLEQVFSNLISNAVKYAKQSAQEIYISCKEKRNEHEFTVSDNGIGIDPQYHDKIFEIFQTLREKHAQESTGIGLAIVKKIIEDQHCSIKVRSELGEGASFSFTWPKN